MNNGNLSDDEKKFLLKQYNVGEINLRQGIEIILENYKTFRKIVRKEESRRKNINFKPERIQFGPNKNLLTNLIFRGLSTNCIREIIDETNLKNKFSSKGSKRYGNLTVTPFLAIKENNDDNNEININLPKDYYITYLFLTNLDGFYLTLMWGGDEVRAFQNQNDGMFIKRSQSSVIKKYEYLTGNKFDLNKFNVSKIDLKCSLPYDCSEEEIYEDGVIFSKFYAKENIPPNEMLVNDLKDYLKLYDFCLNYNVVPTIKFDSIEKVMDMVYGLLKEIFERYEVEKTKSFRNNEFIKEMTDKFYDCFYQFISELVGPAYDGKFDVNLDFGKDDWNDYPVIKINYDKLSNNASKGLYVHSLLNTSTDSIEFGIALDDNDFNHVSNKSLLNYLSNFIPGDEILLDEANFKIILNTDRKIEAMPDEILKKEFEKAIKQFEDLIDPYIGYIFEREIKGFTNTHDNSILNIDFNDLYNVLPEDFEITQEKLKELSAAFNSNSIILKVVPGTGKTLIAEALASLGLKNDFSEGYLLTTATSDWSTFDTIGGLMLTDDEKLVFRPGKFLEAIASNKWLIIDEINRADIDKAFGQLFTVLSGYDVELPYNDSEGNPIKIVRNDYSNKSYRDPVSGSYVIGKNWRVIGTMNTVDKDTLYDLSFAFMRRFMFVDIDVPNYDEKFKEKWINRYFKKPIDKNYFDELKGLWEISSSREFGPAIYGDLLKYISERIEMDNDLIIFKSSNYTEESTESNDDGQISDEMISFYSIIASGINAYIIPQLEGLSDIGEVKEKIWKYFEAYYKDNTSIDKNKLNEILDDMLKSNLV